MSRAYPPASFDPPEAGPGPGLTWFRVFRCGTCQTTLGRQRIGPVYGRDEAGRGLRLTGYTIERVELDRSVIALPPLADGTLRFGLPTRAYLAAPSRPGVPRRPALRRATSVLPSVEGGDPYWVTRHDPRRARTSEGTFVLALTGTQALLPFVVTCPVAGCRRHWLVGGLPPAAELERAQAPTTPS